MVGNLSPDIRNTRPHAVYRMYADGGACLYVGCSVNPFGNRLRQHGDHRPWINEVTTVLVKWYPGWLEGSTAEMEAIAAETPKYNTSRPTPPSARAPTPFRGDGVHCPKCGTLIEGKRKGKAYCNVCYREYRRAIRNIFVPKTEW
jgi:hypothetical protein